MVTKSKLTDRQGAILVHLKNLNDEGLDAYGGPMGISRLHLAGEGPGATGLLKRGLMEERNNLFYITEEGMKAVNHWLGEAPPMQVY